MQATPLSPRLTGGCMIAGGTLLLLAYATVGLRLIHTDRPTTSNAPLMVRSLEMIG